MKHILIAYFSSGHARAIAEELATATGVDIEEITELHPRHGAGGVWRALWDASWRRRARIQPIRHDPADYDLLVLGGPIWCRSMRRKTCECRTWPRTSVSTGGGTRTMQGR